MKKCYVLLLVCCLSVLLTAAVPERAAVTRNLDPEGGAGWLWFMQDQADWSGYTIGPVTYWGWGNNGNDVDGDGNIDDADYKWLADAKWGDFNGDGIDDKVMIVPIPYWPGHPTGTPGDLATMQLAVTYSIDNGDGTVDYVSPVGVFAPEGDNCLEWACWGPVDTVTGFSEYTFLPDDLDGDGFADNIVAMKQNYTANPDATMLWNAYISNGAPGMPKWTAEGTYYNTTWTAPGAGFGVEKQNALIGDINGDGYADRVIWEFNIVPLGDPAVDTTFIWVAVDYSDNVPGDSVYWGDGLIDEYGLLECGVTSQIDQGDFDLQVTDINGDGMEDMAISVQGDPNGYAGTNFLYGWFTRPQKLTGYAADASDLPTIQAWSGQYDVVGNAGFPGFEENIYYAVLDAPLAEPNLFPESVALYRPEGPWYVYSPDDEVDWIDGVVDQTSNFGWSGTTRGLADFNGDGIADKVLTQVADDGQGLTLLQTVAAYTDPDGDFENSVADVVQSNWDWLDAYALDPMYGDFDGDGIADAGFTSDGLTVFGAGGDPCQLIWSAWLSQGNVGVSYDFGGAANHAGWNTFGDTRYHIPVAGDVNGDGVDDRLIFDPVTFGLYVDYSNPAGGYGDSIIDQSVGFGYVAGDRIAMADVNGDGFDDVVVVRDETGVLGDFYSLYAYYTDPDTGLMKDVSVDNTIDMQTTVGVPSLNDEVLFGYIPEPLGYCNLFDIDGDCDLDTDDLAVMAGDWTVLRGFLNESFEDDVVTDGSSISITSGGVLTGWNNNLGSEPIFVVNPSDGEDLQPADGENFVLFSSFVDPTSENIAQFEGGHPNLGNSFHDIMIEENTSYTVLVKVANPGGFEGSYSLQLVAMDDFGAELIINTLEVVTGTVAAGSNDWRTVAVSWSSESDPSLVGDRLVFSLSGYDAAFDDVVFVIGSDITADGEVNLEDFALLAQNWYID